MRLKYTSRAGEVWMSAHNWEIAGRKAEILFTKELATADDVIREDWRGKKKT